MKMFSFKALENVHLDLFSAFLVVQEMSSHWPHIVSNTSATGEFQEFQGRVDGAVSCNDYNKTSSN